MAEIHLANGRGVALMDDEDVQRVPLTGWWLASGYAARTQAIMMKSITSTTSLLDCRKVNLRFVTRSRNNQNKLRALSNSSTGARGVVSYMTKAGERYVACIQLNGKHIREWGFTSVEAAAEAASRLRREHFTHSEECR